MLTLAMGVSLGFLVAQERTITGTVTAADDGSSIPGVNVLLKGRKTGVVTDASGKYLIEVPEKGGTLAFSFIGYVSQEVTLEISNIVNVKLSADVIQLNEAVVTGYGISGEIASVVKRSSKGNAADSMGAGEPLMSPEYSVQQDEATQAERGDNADGPEQRRVHAARVAGQVELMLHRLERGLRRKARGKRPQPAREGQQHAFAKRLAELDFFERQRLVAGREIGQAGCQRVGRAG